MTLRVSGPGLAGLSVFGAGMAFCGAAEAHLESSGLGPFYDGLLHLLSSPDDLVPVVALSLLAGLRGARLSRLVVCLLPASWFIASLAGMAATGVQENPPLGTALSFILLGGLVLTDARVPPWLMLFLTIVLGAIHGWFNGSGMGGSVTGVVALLGVAATVFVCCALVAAPVSHISVNWQRIAVRVLGSWIAAAGLLLAGWSFRGV